MNIASGGRDPSWTSRRRPFALRAALALVFVLTNLPLLRLGFGSDIDAWLIADSADRMVASGAYVRSRSTGFPVYELSMVAPIRLGGWIASNTFSLLAALAIFGALVRMERAKAFRHPRLVQVATLFAPIVFIHASTTMDYLFGLAFVLGGLAAHLEGRTSLAAVLFGIACGVRPTNALFAAAVSIDLARHDGMRRALRFAGLALLVGLVAFAPALTRLPFDVAAQRPSLRVVRRVLEVFGPLQSAALAAIVGSAFTRSRRQREPLLAAGHRRTAALHATVVALYLAVFAFESDEPAYLLPAVPSFVALLDHVLSQRWMTIAAAVVLSRHLVDMDLRAPIHFTPGLTILDVRHRVFQTRLRDRATAFHPVRPTLFLEGLDAPVISTHNPAWGADPATAAPTRLDGRVILALFPRSNAEADSLPQDMPWVCRCRSGMAGRADFNGHDVACIESLDRAFDELEPDAPLR